MCELCYRITSGLNNLPGTNEIVAINVMPEQCDEIYEYVVKTNQPLHAANATMDLPEIKLNVAGNINLPVDYESG